MANSPDSPRSPRIGKHSKMMRHDICTWLEKHGAPVENQINPEEIARIKNIFYELDEDGSGAIDVAEINAMVIKLGLPKTEARAIQAAFDHFDADGSGEMEVNEFIDMMTFGQSAKKHIVMDADIANSRAAFKRLAIAHHRQHLEQKINSSSLSEIDKFRSLVELLNTTYVEKPACCVYEQGLSRQAFVEQAKETERTRSAALKLKQSFHNVQLERTASSQMMTSSTHQSTIRSDATPERSMSRMFSELRLVLSANSSLAESGPNEIGPEQDAVPGMPSWRSEAPSSQEESPRPSPRARAASARPPPSSQGESRPSPRARAASARPPPPSPRAPTPRARARAASARPPPSASQGEPRPSPRARAGSPRAPTPGFCGRTPRKKPYSEILHDFFEESEGRLLDGARRLGDHLEATSRGGMRGQPGAAGRAPPRTYGAGAGAKREPALMSSQLPARSVELLPAEGSAWAPRSGPAAVESGEGAGGDGGGKYRSWHVKNQRPSACTPRGAKTPPPAHLMTHGSTPNCGGTLHPQKSPRGVVSSQPHLTNSPRSGAAGGPTLPQKTLGRGRALPRRPVGLALTTNTGHPSPRLSPRASSHGGPSPNAARRQWGAGLAGRPASSLDLHPGGGAAARRALRPHSAAAGAPPGRGAASPQPPSRTGKKRYNSASPRAPSTTVELGGQLGLVGAAPRPGVFPARPLGKKQRAFLGQAPPTASLRPPAGGAGTGGGGGTPLGAARGGAAGSTEGLRRAASMEGRGRDGGGGGGGPVGSAARPAVVPRLSFAKLRRVASSSPGRGGPGGTGARSSGRGGRKCAAEARQPQPATITAGVSTDWDRVVHRIPSPAAEKYNFV